MYVPDQYRERAFYEALGFSTVYEGEEFPGFLALSRGGSIFGLQASSEQHPPYAGGLRWQFEVETETELAEVIGACEAHSFDHRLVEERGGDRFHTWILVVRSPAGVDVWIEGPSLSGGR